jgi:aspartate aminotransferase-like enzyme
VERLTAPVGEVVPLDRIRDALRSGGFDAITTTQNETALGVLADIGAIAALVREAPDCLLLVDAVSSAGGVPIETDAWGADAVVSASQKALALPPGLGFAAVSERFVARAATLADRGTYLDIARYEEFAAKSQSPTTPAVSLLFALDQQLADIEAEGLKARFERHRQMETECTAWLRRAESAGLGVTAVVRGDWRSPTVTCMRTEGKNAAILQRMRDRGFELGGGQAPLGQTSIRVGHMGDHTPGGVTAMLAVLEEVLRAR